MKKYIGLRNFVFFSIIPKSFDSITHHPMIWICVLKDVRRASYRTLQRMRHLDRWARLCRRCDPKLAGSQSPKVYNKMGVPRPPLPILTFFSKTFMLGQVQKLNLRPWVWKEHARTWLNSQPYLGIFFWVLKQFQEFGCVGYYFRCNVLTLLVWKKILGVAGTHGLNVSIWSLLK